MVWGSLQKSSRKNWSQPLTWWSDSHHVLGHNLGVFSPGDHPLPGIGKTTLENSRPGFCQFSSAFGLRPHRRSGTGRRAMADTVLASVFQSLATELAWAVGTQCLAKRGAHRDRLALGHLSRLEAWLFTSRDFFRAWG